MTNEQIALNAAHKCLTDFSNICDVKVPISQLPKVKQALENATRIILLAIRETQTPIRKYIPEFHDPPTDDSGYRVT